MGGGGSGRSGIAGIRMRTFLDRPTVIEALEHKYRIDMMRLGGFLRTTMQKLMRHRDRPSKPGEAPTSWRRSKGGEGALRALIEFGYDTKEHTLICGPQKITSPTFPLGGKSVPQLLNEGGVASIRLLDGSRGYRTFAARPFVDVALQKTLKAEKMQKIIERNPLSARSWKGR